MNHTKKLSSRLVSLLLCLALVLGYFPAIALTASSAQVGEAVADVSSMDGWRKFFLEANGDFTTENAGGVWTDKSVFTDASEFDGLISMGQESFLVALSAIASNMTVTGVSSVPTDTVLVLDVSGSMDEDHNDVAEALVDSANDSLQTLLEANPNNRVGVVLYSGPATATGSQGAADATLLLPLGRYTTSDAQGRYINYSDSGNSEYVRLNSSVVYEGTATAPTSASKQVVGGTYIQIGLKMAMDQFLADSNVTYVVEGNTTVKRKPILVLMSDGAPTLATTDFTDPGASQLGDGTSTSAAMGFVTQLTAAYAKYAIEQKYETDCLFYTLGLAVGSNAVATSVLDPVNSTAAIDEFWQQYSENDRVVVQAAQEAGPGQGGPGQGGPGSSTSQPELAVEKVTLANGAALEQEYVDQYFSVSGSSLSQGLQDAFAEIVGAIQLQSKYFPTLVSGDEKLSGYVSFVDQLGQYMKVTDMKGILIDDHLFSGAALAENFAAGAQGGILGTTAEPTALGIALVDSIQQRLGLATEDEARSLIWLAYQNGQMYYNSASDYSNYFGWYANAAGAFLGFWHEGITTMPDPSDPSLTDETRPVYINRSYIYLGQADADHGITEANMMYATVRIQEEIASGQQTVAFAVPAALIPVVTYEVTLGDNGTLTALTATGADAPISLIYGVGLDPEINEFNFYEKVSSEYIAANTDVSGNVRFYANEFERDGSVGYNKDNAYAYFRPSRQNDRYYYQEDILVYADDQGTVYNGSTQPSGQMYHAYTVYKSQNGQISTQTVYHTLTAEALATAQQVGTTGTWYISAGTVRRDYYNYYDYKADDTLTNTLDFIAVPYTDVEGHHVDDLDHQFVVGTVLGNNGVISYAPPTGVKLTKTFAGTTVPDAAFAFEISGNVADGSYPAQRILADATVDSTLSAVTFSGGKATVTLKAGQSITVLGLAADVQLEITESETEAYVLTQVNGAAAAGSTYTLTTQAGSVPEVIFTNAERSQGNLTVAKEVEHDLGQDYTIPEDKTFTMEVTLSGYGTANATLDVLYPDGTAGTVTTDAQGKLTEPIVLKNDEKIEFVGLYEGVTAVVQETVPTGFTAQYWVNGAQAAAGQVTVEADRTVSVIVVNHYEPSQVYPVNVTVSGTKNLKDIAGQDYPWQDDYSFTFTLERREETGWQTIDTQTVKGSDSNAQIKSFDFTDAMNDEQFDAPGDYYYRVRETVESLSGFTYDSGVHAFYVTVGDPEMDGKLDILAVTAYRDSTVITQPTSDSWHVQTAFVNAYSADAASAVIAISKQVENPSGSALGTAQGFTFQLLEAVEQAGTWVPGEVLESYTTTLTGVARFSRIFDTAGTYRFFVRELNEGKTGWTYDDTPRLVIIKVTDDGAGSLSAAVYTDEANAATAVSSLELSFTNTYDPVPTTLTVDFVSKLLEGRDLEAGEFRFQITDLEGNPITTGTNAAAGAGEAAQVTFQAPLSFTKPGTYFYNITELAANSQNIALSRLGITADKNTYRIFVTVADRNGALEVAGYSVVNAPGDQVQFVNSYSAQPVSHSVMAKKTLQGRILLNDEFQFEMIQVQDTLGTALAGAQSITAWNFADGTVTFPAITYDQAGTYYYKVTERAGDLTSQGIHYDDTVFLVTVTVEDNGTGNLYVASETAALLGNGPAALEFVNKYIPVRADITLPGSKVLTGRVLGDEEFTFQVYASDAQGNVIGEPLKEAVNQQDGQFSFNMNWSQVGVYYYVVREEQGDKGGIIYDTTSYLVRVTVTDDLRGQLHARTLITNNGIPTEEIVFYNYYVVEGTEKILLEGTKTLTGRDLADGEFTFRLFEQDGTQPLMTTTNTDGMFSFELEYGPEDLGQTFYYTVDEDSTAAAAGITYDDTVYTVCVTVGDDGNGKLVTQTTVSQGETSVSRMQFANTYTQTSEPPEPVTLEVRVTKTVENKGEETIGPEGFLFRIQDMESGEYQDVRTGESGKFSVGITFDESDVDNTYTFKVWEIDEGEQYVTYSEAVYTFTVTVFADDQGNLGLETVCGEKTVEFVDAQFVNIYDYTKPVTPVTGDSANLVLWMTLLLLSGGAVITLMVIGKKKEQA